MEPIRMGGSPKQDNKSKGRKQAENDLVASSEKSTGTKRESLFPGNLTVPTWMNPTNRAKSSKKGSYYESFSESVRQAAGESFNFGSYSNSFSKNRNVNLPFLVQIMQPGMDLEALEEDQVRRISNYSNKSKSQRSSSRLTTRNSNQQQDESEEEEVMADHSENSEASSTKPDPLLKHDPLLGRSLRVGPHHNRSNQDCFMDNLLEHVAQLEEDNVSVVDVEADDDNEEEGDDVDEPPVPIIQQSEQQDIEGGKEEQTESNHSNNKRSGETPPVTSETNSLLPKGSWVHSSRQNGGKAPVTSETSSLLPKETWLQKRKKLRRHKSRKRWYHRLHAHWVVFSNIIRPNEIWISTRNFLLGAVLLMMIPLMGLAWLLFYVLDNPQLIFLPNHVAWYVLQVVRWLVTLTLARITQYFLILVTRRTSLMAQCAGPFVTLMAMQSIGWPFVLFSWGTWNLILLHGKNVFCKNWLYFTGIALFSRTHNPDGDNLLESDLYGRIIAAMIAVGFISGVKRTMTALFLSRRMLLYYKPQLKDMMFQMKLVTGIAGLAAETLKPGFGEVVCDAVAKAEEVQIERKTAFMDAVPTFASSPPPNHQAKDSMVDVNVAGIVTDLPFAERGTAARPARLSRDSGNSDTEDYDDKTESSYEEGWERLKPFNDPLEHQRPSSSGSAYGHVIATIETWDPPVDKNSKKEEPTLHDIVQFRQAVLFMEGPYPFSRAFGLCDCRENCIKSAIRVYRKLLKFIPQDEEPTLLYDVIGALAYNANGQWNEKRAMGLMALFTPDKDYRLSRNAFVQACDSVYKKMLFLRASMNNSSKIDSVLEDIFDIFFYGILAIIVLSLLGLDIWPLLVSCSTMLLSFTFAFSATCARSVEGMMLIAVRRPFDIGDRITISRAENLAVPGPGDAWLVEDIDLTTTTLKYLATNEVCTINNSTLTHHRIVNFNRSPKACIAIRVRFTIGTSHSQIERFRRRIQKYLKNRPRNWDALVCFRNLDLNKLEGFVTYLLMVRHTQPWQSPTVMAQKAKLELQVDKVATELKILHVRKPNRLQVEISEESKIA